MTKWKKRWSYVWSQLFFTRNSYDYNLIPVAMDSVPPLPRNNLFPDHTYYKNVHLLFFVYIFLIFSIKICPKFLILKQNKNSFVQLHSLVFYLHICFSCYFLYFSWELIISLCILGWTWTHDLLTAGFSMPRL